MTDQNKPMPKVPPRPVRSVGSSGNWPSTPEGRSSGTGPAASPVDAVTMAAPPSAPLGAEPGSEPGHGLKVVTISPGSISFPDAEEVTSSRLKAMRQDPYLGSTIDGRYKVEALLGEGGMGVVYRCVHTIIGKKVAMKVLRADLARDAEVTERFLNEAKAASTIGNAHIIDISDFGQFQDGSTYFVMEFLVGQPLTKAIDGGQAVPVPRIIHIARQLAEGLSAAHAANIVHRDLKPDNIFLIDRGGERDFVKILDFGIAKVSSGAGEGAKLTRAGAVFGTPHYMSPEQAAGQPVDHRGDIYSFGVILYEMASGRVPFDADNFMGILTQHMYKAPVPIRALVPQPQEVPPGLEAIVLKCLSKRPDHRYQSMDELIGDLDKLKAGNVPDAVPEMMSRSGGFNVPADYFAKPSMPEPVPASPSSGHQKSRWPLIAGLTGVAAAVAIVGAIFAKSSQSSAQAEGTTPRPQPTETVAAPAPPPPAENLTVSKQVALAVTPPEARIFHGDKDLGTSPVLVEVEEGKTLVLTVRSEGYKDLELTLDGSRAKESIKLERLPKAAGYVPRPQPKKATPTAEPKPKKKAIGGGEIVNPWD